MTSEVDLLFVYGTLLPAFNKPLCNWLKEHSEPVSEGYMSGLLYKVADYPGAVYILHSVTKVYGLVVKMNDPVNVLSHLDRYEGVNAESPDQGEYVRQIVTINGFDGVKRKCWVYLYNYDVRHLELIKSGDYFTFCQCNF